MTELLGRKAHASDGAEEPAPARQARLRRRARLLLWGLPLVLAALLAAGKLVSMTALGQAAIWSFDAKDAAGVDSAARGMGFLDIVETHKSHFAMGDAAVLGGEWERARAEFEEALRLTGSEDECTVRVNLVLTLEKLGDAARDAGDAAKAAARYGDGEKVVAAAPQGCFQQGSPQNQLGQGERLGEAKDRLEGKRGAAQTPGQPSQPSQPNQQPGPAPGAPPSPTPGQSGTPGASAQDQRLRDLERKSQAGQQERSDGQQRDDYLNTPPSAPVDRPW
jgi:hypothetical protein